MPFYMLFVMVNGLFFTISNSVFVHVPFFYCRDMAMWTCVLHCVSFYVIKHLVVYEIQYKVSFS